MFKFGSRSEKNLIGVHPDLVRLCRLALKLSNVDFAILDGVRTAAEQEQNIANGKSWTKNSRHLRGLAIDYGVYVNGKYLNGDTPDEYKYYVQVHEAFAVAALQLKIPIVWGGDWKKRDGGHIELDRRKYP